MFDREADMTRPASKWLRSAGLEVKPEFTTLWGICDLAGASLREEGVKRRLDLKQTKPVSSMTRVELLLRIPDVETNGWITIDRLVRECAPALPKKTVLEEVDRLVEDRYVQRSGRTRLQKLNGWLPLHDRLVAVELKLSRIEEALSQARDNLSFADESYAGFPSVVARRVMTNRTRWDEFFDRGVGLLGITRRDCKVFIPAERGKTKPSQAVQVYCVERFWRSRVRGN